MGAKLIRVTSPSMWLRAASVHKMLEEDAWAAESLSIDSDSYSQSDQAVHNDSKRCLRHHHHCCSYLERVRFPFLVQLRHRIPYRHHVPWHHHPHRVLHQSLVAVAAEPLLDSVAEAKYAYPVEIQRRKERRQCILFRDATERFLVSKQNEPCGRHGLQWNTLDTRYLDSRRQRESTLPGTLWEAI
jgi:hypothetical protein